MKKFFLGTVLLNFVIGGAYAADADLSAAIENVRSMCGGISAELSDMKKMAGINTAVTAVGTTAGGVALGTGIAKAGVDKDLMQKEAEIDELMKKAGFIKLETEDELLDIIGGIYAQTETDFGNSVARAVKARQQEVAKLKQKSKNLGNWRTAGLATATVANIAGAVIAGNNRVKGDLKQQIDECLASVKTLSNIRMQARIDGSATDTDLARAEEIIRACDAWTTVDVTPINKRSTGATVSSGIGAGLGLAGTITSASANSKDVRDGDDKQKEKNLNTAANVLAGGTTVAGGVATVFNATQIGAIKRAVEIAEKCEEALQ